MSYDSVERLWKIKGGLSRRWESASAARYETQLALTWAQSRNEPVGGGEIELNSQIELNSEIVPVGDSGETPQGDATPVDYADGLIPMTPTWRAILQDQAKTVNTSITFQRDTRDNQIAPSRGAYLKASALYAIEVAGRSSQVVDSELEGRYYRPLGRYLVWAGAARLMQTASLQNSRAMPQAYWIELGGEGSVRGVDRGTILAVDGGRTGLNLRMETRLRTGAFGGVLFWDRAGVWRLADEAKWSGMVDGYGLGVRYDLGIPLRLDVGWSEDFDQRAIYFSIGQAF